MLLGKAQCFLTGTHPTQETVATLSERERARGRELETEGEGERVMELEVE